jgi:DNA-binding MarR family transcriptional regulator
MKIGDVAITSPIIFYIIPSTNLTPNYLLLRIKYSISLAIFSKRPICFKPGVSLIDLTKISHLDKANTTRAINDLEQKGYVVKRANEKDSRKYKIYITDKTREIAEKLNETRIALNKKAFKGITKAEKKNFIKTFHKICKNLDVL